MNFLAAAGMATDAAGAQAAPTAGGTLGLFLPMIIVFVVFYFIVIGPQRKQQKQRDEM